MTKLPIFEQKQAESISEICSLWQSLSLSLTGVCFLSLSKPSGLMATMETMRSPVGVSVHRVSDTGRCVRVAAAGF